MCPAQASGVRRSRSKGLQDKTKRLDPPREEKKQSLVASRSNGGCTICVLLGRKAEPTARQLQACMAFCLNNNRQNSARCAVLWPYCGRIPLPTIPPFTVQGVDVSCTCTWLCTWPTRYLRMHYARNSLSIPCHKAQQQACCIGEPIFCVVERLPVTARDCPFRRARVFDDGAIPESD